VSSVLHYLGVEADAGTYDSSSTPPRTFMISLEPFLIVFSSLTLPKMAQAFDCLRTVRRYMLLSSRPVDREGQVRGRDAGCPQSAVGASSGGRTHA
jgi:hypothetical protein